jgi:hypothetical protein
LDEISVAEKIRTAALELLETGSTDSIIKAADLLKVLADIEQQKANAAKLEIDRQKAEQDLIATRSHWKDFFVAATPLFTTIILAGTLIFQIRQAHQSELDRREDSIQQAQKSEQMRFSVGLNTLTTTDGISPAAALLSSFATEPQKSQARQMAIKLMRTTKSVDDYSDLFFVAYGTPNGSDLPTLLRLNREVSERYNSLTYKVWDTAKNDLDMEKLNPSDRATVDLLLQKMTFLSGQISPLVRADGSESEKLDLSGAAFRYSSLQGADLRYAKLTGSSFTYENIDGCDLGDVAEFENATFSSEVWWHAARVSPPLLAYLSKNYPYKPGRNYPNATVLSSAEYVKNVERLQPHTP